MEVKSIKRYTIYQLNPYWEYGSTDNLENAKILCELHARVDQPIRLRDNVLEEDISYGLLA